MFNFEKALKIVLNDPVFADVKPRKKRATSSDKLIAIFQEVMAFYEKMGRLPEDNPEEWKLYHRWIGILKKEHKIEHCRPYDDYKLLPEHPISWESEKSETLTAVEDSSAMYHSETTLSERLEAVLNDPLFDNMVDTKSDNILDIPEYMRHRLNARREAEYIGKRRPCEDFDNYSDGFKGIHQGLKSGKYKLIKFSVKNLKVGSYFVEDGIIGYLAAFEDEGVNRHGDRDGRTRVIYENGSEADIKYKTITKNLSITGSSVIDCSDLTTEELEQCFTINEMDVESGTIYVLRSKSPNSEIAAIKDLYKIGFTVTSVESRIANARKEPTYLFADVEVVGTWKVYNVKSSTFEALIHKLFAPVQLQITVDGHRPQEWFIVPFNVIKQAVEGLIKGKPMIYEPQLKQLIFL